MGVVTRETTSDTRTAADRVTANSLNSRPSRPPMPRMGIKMATREKLMETMVNDTSLLPRKAAFRGETPSSMWRTMFSVTTMASSTTKPVAMVRAMRERWFREKPDKYMTPKVPSRETGTATAGIQVARPLRRNRNTTSTTRPMEMSRVRSTSRTEAVMEGERSMIMVRSVFSGIQARRVGMAARMLSTVSMMFAPGCL